MRRGEEKTNRDGQCLYSSRLLLSAVFSCLPSWLLGYHFRAGGQVGHACGTAGEHSRLGSKRVSGGLPDHGGLVPGHAPGETESAAAWVD